MREMDDEQRARLDERRQQFEAFLGEIDEVLRDLSHGLGLPEPGCLLEHADHHLADIDRWVAEHAIDPALRGRLLARIGCLAGQVLVSRLGGRWFLNEDPDSPHFLHFAVGGFGKLSEPALMADPFAIAAAYLDRMDPKDLGGLIGQVVLELRAAAPPAGEAGPAS